MNDVRLASPLTFSRGPAMGNRIALSPMTTDQAQADGSVGDDESRWITMRARGGFGLVMTSASYVQPSGKGGAGQTGIFKDDHVAGLSRLAHDIRVQDRVAILQLHHAGIRASKKHVPDLVGPSADPKTGARALTTGEVEAVVTAFVDGAVRAERAGFHGVELHGAHGYLLAQFLSRDLNRRADQYGGSLANRARIMDEIIAGIRRQCAPDFQLGVRLSPERFGMSITEQRELLERWMAEDQLEWIDMSLWDVMKSAEEPGFRHLRLVDCYVDVPRGRTRLGVAGKIHSAATAAELLSTGVDLVFVGRAAILHHDWPRRALSDPTFRPVPTPVELDYLAREGLGPRFLRYIKTFPGFVIAD
jgi:2,4-dienoyl-CoA reductase-like NADH-dependent reductase (Old Yellow Enzyme family)